MSEPTTLGRFGHHPDPAIDFCTEVDAIEGLYADCLAKLEVFADADARAARAMGFRVGGDPSAVSAKDRLQELVSARKPTTILDAKDAEITSLRAQLDEARRRAIQLPKWNDLTAAQRNAIADGILLPHPEERMQTAIEVYAAVRRALLSESKT